MKHLSLIAIFLISLSTKVSAQQVSIFDSEGEAIAYIDYEKEATIFLWDGTPAAFLEKDGNKMCVWGFNSSFLGWYEDGIVYDKKGYAVGARKNAMILVTRIERIKGIQRIVPIKPITMITPIQPILKKNWSSETLVEFLSNGKK
jgi:hypothetical protein